ncbi:putative ATP-dependent RNA helicase BoYb [Drosophila ficusphila]|uniref:putative ATP-dependent RNA helicase BoYb n=1 Tax=Drosophila ficusphila TaxID=30025 RepID=UPI0007E72BFF|nr:putative ATP-dependent RNA helicase BoYb [Drosophila ficusphila]
MGSICDEKLSKIMDNFDDTWEKITNSSSASVEGIDYEGVDCVLRPLKGTICSEYVVAHGRCPLRPVRNFGEVFLLPHILESMHKLGLNKLLRLQSYTWPHLAKGAGRGAMIVGAPCSGRTLSYLPVVCHAVCTDTHPLKEDPSPLGFLETGAWRPDEYGPRALIVVPDLQRVLQVSALCHALLRHTKKEDWFTLTLNVSTTRSAEFFLRLLNGVGCLVATPAQLVWFWQEHPGLMRFPRLQFLVYDDVDLMSAEQLTAAQQVVQGLLPLTSHPQVVMVSQHYRPKLMAELRAVNDDPALVFGDILEAALYGGTRIRISISCSAAKSRAVVQALQQCPPKDFRTVIFCTNDTDIQQLVVALEDQGYDCLPYFQTAGMTVHERVLSWQENTCGAILLCTDSCPELIIRDAHSLIHYSMSRSWSQFKLRHLVLSEHLSNLFASPVGPLKRQLQSLVLLDDSNHRKLPRLVDFLQVHQEVDPAVLAVAKRLRQEMDNANNKKVTLCSQILTLGKCYKPVCTDRHHLSNADRCPDYMPASGDVKLQLVRVYSPTHFCVRLLEHMPPNGTWQLLPNPAVQQMRLQLMQEQEPRRYWPPVVGDICMYHGKFTKERVRVLKVAAIENPKVVQSDLSVEVQGLDVDTRTTVTTCGQLFDCPEAVQREPPLACDLRLFGLVPYSGERSWTEESKQDVRYVLSQLPNDHFLQAKIEFTAAGTLFVRDLVAIVYADQIKTHLRYLCLAKKLIATTMAKRCVQATDWIRDFFKEALIDVEEEGDLAGHKARAEQPEENEVENKLKEACPAQVQSKPVLSGRCQRLVKLALEMGRENELQQIQRAAGSAMGEELAGEMTNLSVRTNENTGANSENDKVAQLYECVRKCALLQLEDRKEQAQPKESDRNCNDPVEFLKQVLSTEDSIKRRPKQNNKASAAKPAKEPPNHFQMEIELPPNVVRPPVTYYQTISTLELQVSLPDDGQEYSCFLQEPQIFFRATSKSSSLIQQFVLTLKLPCRSLRHHSRGRTVYISVTKELARYCPLALGEYRFLKPNYDMFDKVDYHQQKARSRLIRFLENFGYAKPKARSQEASEESEDEEPNLVGVERGDINTLYD